MASVIIDDLKFIIRRFLIEFVDENDKEKWFDYLKKFLKDKTITKEDKKKISIYWENLRA